MSTNAATQMVLGVVILITAMIAFGIFVIVLSGDDVLSLSQFGSYTGVTQILRLLPLLISAGFLGSGGYLMFRGVTTHGPLITWHSSDAGGPTNGPGRCILDRAIDSA